MRPAAALVCLIALIEPLAALAQDTDNAEGQLEEIESAIREREAREKGLDSEVKDVSGEVNEIRRDLINAAAVVQDQETQLDDTEREIADLDRRYAERQGAFEKHRAELERTLSALALFARSPPQALIGRPGEWADTVRGLALLDEAIPGLKRSADAAAEAAALAALRDARSRRQIDLVEDRASLAEKRADLRRLLERKSSLHATLVAERRRIGIEIATLGAEATDTRDLIDRLEMARAEVAARQADEAAARAAQPVRSLEPSGTLLADDLALDSPPPLSAAPVEPQASAAAAAASPSLDEPEPGTVETDTEARSRLAIVTPPAPTTPTDSLAAAAASSDLAGPELAAIETDTEAAPRLARLTPSSPGAPADSPAAAPSSDLARLGAAIVEPEADASTRLAALPVSPPRPPVNSSLPYPAHGYVITRFGARIEGDQKSLGTSIRTRESAQVVAPRRGEVVFAGSFRGFGQLLILEHEGGYHSLLSGFSRIDAQVGQQVLAGEPVGVMGIVAESATILYIEIRQNRQPIDPIPWLLAGDRKVSG
jgi:septal ring factor EnvC (AmiA/AmiB activator)